MSITSRISFPRAIVFHCLFLFLLYSWVRWPFFSNPPRHDETYSSFAFLSSLPAMPEINPKSLEWKTDWFRQIFIHPPGVSIFYFGWIRLFGDSIMSLRIPSFLAGALSMFLFYILCCWAFGSTLAFYGGLWLVFSYSHVAYSMMAVQTIFEILIIILSAVVIYGLTQKKNKNLVLPLGIVNFVGILTFYHYAVFLFLQDICLFQKRDEFSLGRKFFIPHIILLSGIAFLFFLGMKINKYDVGFWPMIDSSYLFKTLFRLPVAAFEFS